MASEYGVHDRLHRLFNPKTIAVVGATNRKGSVGYSVIRNLIGSDYEGVVYPINPRRESILGVKVYPSVKETPDDIDLAVIATPARTVPAIVRECGESGVSGIVILTAGFAEIGEEGQKASEEIKRIARECNMRIIGPNCLGFMRPSLNLNASFASKMALPGKIAFISQSGALGTAVLDWSVRQNVGFSFFVSIGSMLDVGFNDLIDFFGQDSGTSSIVIYMESLANARKFMSAARAFARTKPIIVLKVGRSSEGAQAAASHTGTLAGNDAVFDAAFKRAGVIRVKTVEELFNCAQTLAMQKRPSGNRLAIVTNAGGPGVIATDYLIEKEGTLARLSEETIEKLNEVLPDAWSHNNPVDVLGDADEERYRLATEICINDPGVDGLLVLLTPQAMTNAAEVARNLVSLPTRNRKTMLASFMGEDDVNAGVEILEQGNIPAFNAPEAAVDCFMNMYSYSRNLDLLYETPESIPHDFTPRTEDNRKIIQKAAAEDRYVLTQAEAREFLGNYDIPVIRSEIAETAETARTVAEKIGFPVAMSILSPDVLHKTDVGGLSLGIRNEDEAEEAFKTITASVKKHMPDADIQGIVVAEMVSKKYELIIGANKDPIFGPTIVFGMGGVAVEVFKDTNIGLPPMNMALAKRLIEDTKIYTLIKGYRGMQGVDIPSIQFLLYKFAYLLIHFPEIKEIDINPFAVDHEGGAVLDGKVILDEAAVGAQSKPFSRLVISPYPQEFTKECTLNNGEKVILRPIRPEDEPLEGEMFTTFSERTQRFRFFQLIGDITHDMLIRYTQIDYDREIAIIAEHTDSGGKKRMLGVVRLISDPYNETAEFAIVVGDPWHGQGLGNMFTDMILDVARQRGSKKITANVLKDNFIMKHIFEKRGFTIQSNEDMWCAELEL
ncbi:MAG: acetate--CoA ligase alpha subunit [Planctomycetota bacterium]|jgi:acetyltransferase